MVEGLVYVHRHRYLGGPRYLRQQGETVSIDPAKARWKGCELAVRTDEFKHRNLGGSRQNQVHVLDDPHGLLSQTVVFKLDMHGAVRREIAALARLDTQLKASNALGKFRHIRPIGTVTDQTGMSWYATTYEPGLDLGQIIFRSLDSDRSGELAVGSILEDVIRFLALFHASGGIDISGTRQAQAARTRFWAEDVSQIVRPFSSEAFDVLSEMGKLVLPQLPLCQKKDAHPENWIITPRNNIVMLDFEASRDEGVTVVNRWWQGDDYDSPHRRPYKWWPSVIDFIGPEYEPRLFFASPKLERNSNHS